MILLHCWQFTCVSWAAAASYGWVGVDLFFALSGYLITRIILHTRSRPGWWSRFMIRRMLRIFPLYFATMFLLLGSRALVGDAPTVPVWSLLTFTSNWFLPFYRDPAEAFYTVTWSLAVEEQFYLLWPLLLAACSSVRMLKAFTIGVLICAPILRFLLHGVSADAAYMFTPCRADALAGGALAALLHVNGQVRAGWVWAAAAGLVALLGALGLVAPLDMSSRLFTSLGLSLVDLLCALTVLGVAMGAIPTALLRALEWRPLTYVGQISFALYLLHTIFLLPIAAGMQLALPDAPNLQFIMLCVLGVLASVGAATLTWRTLEQPMLTLKDRWAR